MQVERLRETLAIVRRGQGSATYSHYGSLIDLPFCGRCRAVVMMVQESYADFENNPFVSQSFRRAIRNAVND